MEKETSRTYLTSWMAMRRSGDEENKEGLK